MASKTSRQIGRCCAGVHCTKPIIMELCSDHKCIDCKLMVHVQCAEFLPGSEKLICLSCTKKEKNLERQRLREMTANSNNLLERKKLAESRSPQKRSGESSANEKTKVQRIGEKAFVETTRPQVHPLPRVSSTVDSSSSLSSNQKQRASIHRSSDKDSDDESSESEQLGDVNTAGNTDIYKRRCRDQFTVMAEKAPTKWLKLMAMGSKKPELQNIYEGGVFTNFLNGHRLRAGFILTARDYQQEILRRSHFLDLDNDTAAKKAIFRESKGKKPCPKYWTSPDLKNWLEAEHHYINTEEDDAFLVLQLQVVTRGVIALTTPLVPVERRMAIWTTSNKWNLTQQCRLVHALLDEPLKDAYLKRNVALTRQQLDARDTDTADDTYWDKVASKFNDANWKPTSIVIADQEWGSFWRESHDLFSVHENLAPITADQVKKKFKQWGLSIKAIKGQWDVSGNGANQHGFDGGGRDRTDLLGNHPEVALYLWYQLERDGLLESILSMLPPALAVGAGLSAAVDESVLTQSSSHSRIERRKKQVRRKEKSAHFKKMCTTLDSLISVMATFSAESQADRTVAALGRAKDSVQFLMGLIDAAKARIDAKKRERLELALKHDPSDSRTSGIIIRYLEDLETSLSKEEEELETREKELRASKRKAAKLEVVVARTHSLLGSH